MTHVTSGAVRRKPRRIEIRDFHIVIELWPASSSDGPGTNGSITSDLPTLMGRVGDALESLILVHACEGINVSSARYMSGITTTIDAVMTHN